MGAANAKNGSGAFLTFTFQMKQTGYSDLYIQNMFLIAKDGVTLIPCNTIDYFTVVRAGNQYDVELMGNPSWSDSNYWGGYYNGSVTQVSQVIGSTMYTGLLSFNINGTADDFGSSAYFNVTIPNDLMNCTNSNQWLIKLNGGGAVAPTQVDVGTVNTTISLEFAYTETPQTAQILSTNIVGGGVHDVAVTDVVVSKTVVGQGFSTSVNVSVVDQGGFSETFKVTVYANAASIASQNVTLLSGNFAAIIFVWNTTGFAYGNYTLSAHAQPVPDEINTANNNLTSSTVKVTLPGDINGDFVVNSRDMAIIAANWLKTVPPAPANADVNGDGVINSQDFAPIAANWLKTA